MLHIETLATETLTLLKRLSDLPALADLRLVGGTSLALQFGHRTSVDLDFCGPRLFGGADEARIQLAAVGVLDVVADSPNVHVYTLDSVKIDIVTSPGAWLEDPVVSDGVRLASPLDIAAMKLQAIVNRGARKDFVDLAVLLERFALPAMINAYQRKYGAPSLFALHKSLVYFDDAEEEPMPIMLIGMGWREVRARVEAAARTVLLGPAGDAV